nr:hypothetical protein [uncultured Pseudomonas sp.]
MRLDQLFATLAIGLLVAGCAGPAPSTPDSQISLPLLMGWFDGQKVYYITTDSSDAQMAAAMHANFVPRLANALPEQPGPHPLATYDRIYKFVGREQPSVLPSIPQPLGAGNQDIAYSPLWHLYTVRWNPGQSARELRSADQVLSAQEQGQISIEATGIIVNCPVVRVAERVLQTPLRTP